MSFTSIVEGCQLPQATVHRLLNALQIEGFIHKDPRTRKYHLGHLLYELGLVAVPLFRFTHECQDALDRLATLTEDTIYLSERIGNEAVAADHREGAYPIKAISLHLGMRRPLGVGAGGLAMLAAMPALEAREIVEANAACLPALGNFDHDFLLSAIEETRRQGYAYLGNKATRGLAAVAVALCDPQSGSRAAICVSAVPPRMTPDRAERIAKEIQREVEAIEKRMNLSSSLA